MADSSASSRARMIAAMETALLDVVANCEAKTLQIVYYSFAMLCRLLDGEDIMESLDAVCAWMAATAAAINEATDLPGESSVW